ncbi:hypothetical protein Leryth_015002, partial [Lithospermum erythrorhizon]
MQCSPCQSSSAASSISSYVDIGTTEESSFMSGEPCTQIKLESTTGHSYIAPVRRRINTDVDIPLSDPRTLILPKVPPCKYCGAYRFYIGKLADFIILE